MSITAAQVKELRESTGAGMMDCKRALAATDGNVEEAVAFLREKGLAGASKKAGRIAAEGLVGVYPSEAGKTALMIELNCETDFVAKNEQFQGLLDKIGNGLISADIPERGSGEAVADTPIDGTAISMVLNEAVSTVGENMSLRRFVRRTSTDGIVGSYVHAGGKIGVLVEIAGGAAEHADLAKSLAMQVAAAFPRYAKREEVPAEEVEKEKEIFRAQALASGKPEKVIDKIIAGKIDKFFGEICLLEQDYVRDPDVTIEKLLTQASKSTGASLTLVGFERFQLGEGIEKRESNLAEEVAAQLAQG